MFLHPPLGPQLDQLPGLSHHIVYTWNRTYCALNRVCLYSFPTDTTGPPSRVNNHLPPLLPTITLDFPVFTFNPLPSRLALQSATRLPSCSIVGAIITIGHQHTATRKSDHFSPRWKQHPWQQQTTVDSVLTLDANQPSLQNFHLVQHLLNYSTSLCIQCHNCADEPLIHTQLPQSPSHHLSWDSIKCLL